MSAIKLLEEARNHYIGQLLAEKIAAALKHDEIEKIVDDDLKAKIARIDALLKTGGWIPVSNDMPKEEVLCYHPQRKDLWAVVRVGCVNDWANRPPTLYQPLPPLPEAT